MPHQSLPTPFSERLLYNEIIYEPLFDECSAATLLRIARTCRAGHRAITTYYRKTFNIDRLLTRFFPSPAPFCSITGCGHHEHSQIYDRARVFRSLQARTGTLISGSCALQFFDRTVYPASDLDLYVHLCHRREVGRWLVQEGYTYEPTTHQDRNLEVEVEKVYEQPTPVEKYSGNESCIYQVFNFKRSILDAKRLSVDDGREHPLAGSRPPEEHGELRIQLIVAKETPMEVILGFHSTCVMNVISYAKAYCLFPQATLEDRLSMFINSPSDDTLSQKPERYQRAVIKYTERGFTFVHPRSLTAVRGTSTTSESEGSHANLSGCADGLSLVVPRVRPRHSSSASSIGASATTVAPSRLVPISEHTPESRGPVFTRKPTFRLGERWIDDSESWVLPLPIAGVALPQAAREDSPPFIRDPVSVCNWEIEHECWSDKVTMHFHVFKIECLRYTYLVKNAELGDHLYLEVHKRAWQVAQIKDLVHPSVDQNYFDKELIELCEDFRQRSSG
ncbi:hypothetical protein C8Q73DRAFT_320240 [Cubamyces lactineus]|nr:hypothetical protein C8Q73DRAFT_320240 [Cubamyces lactineus]